LGEAQKMSERRFQESKSECFPQGGIINLTIIDKHKEMLNCNQIISIADGKGYIAIRCLSFAVLSKTTYRLHE